MLLARLSLGTLFAFDMQGLATEALKASPALVFAFALYYWTLKYIQSQHEKHIKSLNKEIDRVVEEKKDLQQLFIKKLLSTTEKTPPQKGGKKT